jgi:hypothetical protein
MMRESSFWAIMNHQVSLFKSRPTKRAPQMLAEQLAELAAHLRVEVQMNSSKNAKTPMN